MIFVFPTTTPKNKPQNYIVPQNPDKVVQVSTLRDF